MRFEEVLDEIRVDYDTLLSRFSGNRQLLERFIRKFPQDKSFFTLKGTIEARDFEEMARAAHTLKGVSANLGFDELCTLCHGMVQELRAGNHTSIEEGFQAISQEYTRIIQLISQLD